MPRHWMEHRQTYWPRLWPVWLAATALGYATSLAITLALGIWGSWWGVALSVVVTLAWGSTLGVWRMRRWRRRHPVITAEQYIRERARNAPWN